MWISVVCLCVNSFPPSYPEMAMEETSSGLGSKDCWCSRIDSYLDSFSIECECSYFLYFSELSFRNYLRELIKPKKDFV